jgi:hypothetical protein
MSEGSNHMTKLLSYDLTTYTCQANINGHTATYPIQFNADTLCILVNDQIVTLGNLESVHAYYARTGERYDLRTTDRPLLFTPCI